MLDLRLHQQRVSNLRVIHGVLIKPLQEAPPLTCTIGEDVLISLALVCQCLKIARPDKHKPLRGGVCANVGLERFAHTRHINGLVTKLPLDIVVRDAAFHEQVAD